VNRTTHFVVLWLSIHRDLYRLDCGLGLRNRAEILLVRYSLEECKRYVYCCTVHFGNNLLDTNECTVIL